MAAMRWVVMFIIGVITALVASFSSYVISNIGRWKFGVLIDSIAQYGIVILSRVMFYVILVHVIILEYRKIV